MLNKSQYSRSAQNTSQQQGCRPGEKRSSSSATTVVDIKQAGQLQLASASKRSKMEANGGGDHHSQSESPPIVPPFVRSDDEVRTLFVSGLPVDVRQREVFNIFRFYEGYENCIIKTTPRPGKNNAPVAFVTFASREQARVAMNDKQGMKYDPEFPASLRLEFAKSNTKNRGKIGVNTNNNHHNQEFGPIVCQPYHGGPIIQQEVMPGHPLTQFDLVPQHPHQLQQAIPVAQFSHQFAPVQPPPTAQHIFTPSAIAGQMPAQFMNLAAFPQAIHHQQPPAAAAAIGVPLQPAQTNLLIDNIGPNITEQELTGVFSRFHGFCKASLIQRGATGVTLGYIQFNNAHSAAMACHQMQNKRLMDNSAMKIEIMA